MEQQKHEEYEIRKKHLAQCEIAYAQYIANPYSFISDFCDRHNQPTKKSFIKYLQSKNALIRDHWRSILLTDAHYKCFLDVDNAVAIFNKRKCWRDVAKHYNLSSSTIKKIFKYAKVDIQPKIITQKPSIPVEELYKDYLETNSIVVTAKKYNLAIYRVRQAFKVVGLHIHTKQEALKTKSIRTLPQLNVEEVYNTYMKIYSIEKTAKIYNSTPHQIKRLLQNNGYHTLTKKESIQRTYTDENWVRNWISKCKQKSYSHKEYILPSNKVISIQGYEPQFLDYCFKHNVLNENDINFTAPRIPYILDGKQRYYYPDFYIPKFNLIVEIKSDYTLSLTPKEKAEAVKALNYNYITIVNSDFAEFQQLIDNLQIMNK